jgi:hypothetical protein
MVFTIQVRQEIPKPTKYELTNDQKSQLDTYLKNMFEGHAQQAARHPVSTQTTPKKETVIREKKPSVLNIPVVSRDPRQSKLNNFFGKQNPFIDSKAQQALKSPLER